MVSEVDVATVYRIQIFSRKSPKHRSNPFHAMSNSDTAAAAPDSAGEASAATPEPTPARQCEITFRRGTVADCGWIRSVMGDNKMLNYEGPQDGPSKEHFNATWAGRWAERLCDENQVYAVAEVQRRVCLCFLWFPVVVLSI